jgi:hypothetical protein
LLKSLEGGNPCFENYRLHGLLQWTEHWRLETGIASYCKSHTFSVPKFLHWKDKEVVLDDLYVLSQL